MNKRNRRRRYVHRRRSSARKALAIVMLCLLLFVSAAATAFVTIMYLNDMLSVPSIVQVFAGGEENAALANAPGWLGELPEDAPDIGVDVDEGAEVFADLSEAGIDQVAGQEAFAVFPFYIAENARYYAEFQEANPRMNPETVVWKVNAFLHLPFYSLINVNYEPNPLLVNPSHRLPYGFVPAYLIPVYEGSPELLATPETAEAFRRLRASAIRDGLDLAVASAFRTAERQGYLFARQSGDGVVARPYQSEHQTGRALDLWGPGGLLDSGGGPPSATGLWVAENAHNYGFIIRYTAENTHITGFIHEPWHITYVSREFSQYMHRNSLSSLEEFVARNPGIRIGDSLS